MAVELVRAAQVRSVGRTRLPEIDVLKAVGILVVVLIHAARPPWSPDATELERWLGGATRFAVPAFLFASGYLTGRDRDPGGNLVARLRRLLIPYVLASMAAELFHASIGFPWTWRSVLRNLALGSAFGPYYYVFVLLQLTLITPLLARGRRVPFFALLAVSLYYQFMTEAGLALYVSVFWHMRLILLWAPYFLLGWLIGERRDAVVERVERHGVALTVVLATAVCGLLLAMAVIDPSTNTNRTLVWIHIYAMIALLLVVGLRALRIAPRLVHLSDSTYFIYLYHLPFVYAAVWLASRQGNDFHVAWLTVAWTAGLGIPLVLLYFLQRGFGQRTRPILGA